MSSFEHASEFTERRTMFGTFSSELFGETPHCCICLRRAIRLFERITSLGADDPQPLYPTPQLGLAIEEVRRDVRTSGDSYERHSVMPALHLIKCRTHPSSGVNCPRLGVSDEMGLVGHSTSPSAEPANAAPAPRMAAPAGALRILNRMR